MLTIDRLKDYEIPSPLPLDITPRWKQLLFALPFWRFRHPTEDVWVYVTAAQYERLFERRS